MNEDNLVIISQNFNGYISKNEKNKAEKIDRKKLAVANYLKYYNADIVAGQELPAHINEKQFMKDNKLEGSFEGQAEGKSSFFTGFYVNNKKYKLGLNSNEEISVIWEQMFKYCPKVPSFRSGFWAEKWIGFCGESIRIINIHLSLWYDTELRLSFLKYISKIQNPYSIILGDFNAAKVHQTVEFIKKNHEFLTMIEINKYIELIDENEKNKNAHYTHYEKSGGRKLDHIFISKAFYDKFHYEIDYIDGVNETHPDHQNSNQTFTDHSGIKITFWEKES